MNNEKKAQDLHVSQHSSNEMLSAAILIGDFMGKFDFNKSYCKSHGLPEYNPWEDLVETKTFKYNSSWDWQIPAFGRIAMAVKTLIPKLPDPEKNRKWYFRNLDKYEKAIFCNEPIEGFKIITELLKWYNSAIKVYAGSR